MKTSINIGEKLKELRKSRGMTLIDMANKTGFSPAYLSNVERNQTSPTINNLFIIGRALNADLTAIMEDTPVDQGILVRKKDRKQLFCTQSHVTYEAVTEDTHNITGICITINESCYDEIVSTGHSERDELGLITEGSFVLTMNQMEYQLHEGDSIFIAKNTPHSYHKTGPGKCVSYWFYAKTPSHTQKQLFPENFNNG